MTVTVAEMLEQALSLPAESRTELVEAILERSAPSPEFISGHMGVVLERMQNVREGRSRLIPAEEAHRNVREALAAAS